MSVSAVNGDLWPFDRFIVLVLFFYPVVAWALSRSRHAGPMSASVVPATLAPLFLAEVGAWGSIVRVLWALPLMGKGGRAAAAAGLAESFVLLAFGAGVAAFVAAVSWLADRTPSTALPPPARSLNVHAIGFAAVCVALALAHALIARSVNGGALPVISRWVLLIPALAALACFGWLVASRRWTSWQMNASRKALAVSCAIVSGALAATAWHLTKAYQFIAMNG